MIIKKEARKAKSLMNEFTLALAGSNSNGAKILIKSHFDFVFVLPEFWIRARPSSGQLLPA